MAEQLKAFAALAEGLGLVTQDGSEAPVSPTLQHLTPPSDFCTIYAWLHIHTPKHSHVHTCTHTLKIINKPLPQAKFQRLEL